MSRKSRKMDTCGARGQTRVYTRKRGRQARVSKPRRRPAMAVEFCGNDVHLDDAGSEEHDAKVERDRNEELDEGHGRLEQAALAQLHEKQHVERKKRPGRNCGLSLVLFWVQESRRV